MYPNRSASRLIFVNIFNSHRLYYYLFAYFRWLSRFQSRNARIFPDRSAKMFPSKTVKEFPKRSANKFPGKNVSRSQESLVRIYLSRSVRMFQNKSATKCRSRNARMFLVRSAGMCQDKAAKMFQSKTAQLFTSVQCVRNQATSQHQHIRDRLIVTDSNHFSVQCTQSYQVTHSHHNGISGICHTAIQVLFIIFISTSIDTAVFSKLLYVKVINSDKPICMQLFGAAGFRVMEPGQCNTMLGVI